jgi:hypothetical protein
MDAFDRFWQRADKPLDSPLAVPAELHYVVMRLSRKTAAIAARSMKRCTMLC